MITGEALSFGWPEAQWNWPKEGDYESLEWFGPGEKPSLAEIEAAAAASKAPTLDDYKAAIETHVEEAAKAKDYGSPAMSATLSIATYVNSVNPSWAAEAQAFIAWRDAVWVYAFTELAKVQAEERAAPESTEAFISELPGIEWPS